MKTRSLAIIVLVALLGSYFYIKFVWGSIGAFFEFNLKCSLIGVACLVVILISYWIISKIKK